MVAYTCSTLSKSNHVGPQNVIVHIHVVIATIIKFIYNDGAISLVINLCLLLLLLGCQPRNAHHMTITWHACDILGDWEFTVVGYHVHVNTHIVSKNIIIKPPLLLLANLEIKLSSSPCHGILQLELNWWVWSNGRGFTPIIRSVTINLLTLWMSLSLHLLDPDADDTWYRLFEGTKLDRLSVWGMDIVWGHAPSSH